MIDIQGVSDRRDRYSTLPMASLLITAVLVDNTPVCSYDAVNLDNLLARAVIDDALGGTGLPNSDEPYDIPIPVKCLWRSPDGLPLWAATQFIPDSVNVPDTTYWHKRAQNGRFSRYGGGDGKAMPIKTVAGRWMERRVPMPTIVSATWAATCEGNSDEILRLLGLIRYLGKKRAIGMGEVAEWRVQEIEQPFTMHDGAKLLRVIPFEALPFIAPYRPCGALVMLGWTPPQWKPSLFGLGWRFGTAVEIDYFNAASVI